MKIAIITTATAIATLALGYPAFGAQPATPPRYSEGQLLILVSPDYPPEALRKGETGSVAVSGKVRVDGSLANPEIVATPPNPIFEGELRHVVRYWRLQPRLDPADCTFRETTARLTIWFDIDDGKPKVTFARTVPQNVDARLAEQLGQGSRTVVARTEPEYPWHVARNSNAPELVPQLAYAAINADGSVRTVSVAPKRYYDDFREPIETAVRQWRFQPRDRGWCAELPFDFKLPN